jgi:uncharacterized repeat protein (TIGR01451 family)
LPPIVGIRRQAASIVFENLISVKQSSDGSSDRQNMLPDRRAQIMTRRTSSLPIFFFVLISFFFFLPPGYYNLKNVRHIGITKAHSPNEAEMKASPLAANIDITFDSNPVIQPASSCNGVKPAWNFTVTLTETGGVGVLISGFSVVFFDNNSNLVQTQDLSAVDFANLFSQCGPRTNHIVARGRACASLCADLGGAGSGSILIRLSGRDDLGNELHFCGGPLTLAGPGASQGADLSITNTSSSDVVASGRSLLYTITVSNAGPEIATGVTVTDVTPAGTTFNAVAATQGTCKGPAIGSTGAISCSLGSLGPGGSATIWIVVNVAATSGSVVINTAKVTSTSKDPNEADNLASDTTGVISGDSENKSDLTVTSTASPETATPGTQVTYAVTIKNAGPDPTEGLSVIDLLPVGTTFASITTNPTSFCKSPPVGSGGAVVCSISLGRNQSLTITIRVNVIAAAGASLSNKAEIIDDTGKFKFITCNIAVPLLSGFPSEDPNPNDNLSLDGRSVRGGGIVKLSWDQPPPTSGNPTPAPINLRVNVGDLVSANSLSDDASSFNSGISPSAICTLVGYNIFISSGQTVQPIPSNLWKTVSAGMLTSNVPVAPSGSSYLVTAVWHCSAGNKDSGPSNPQSVPGGGNIDTVDISSQLNIRGSGFTDNVEVFIDGVGFRKNARLKNGKQVVQKGALLDGRSIDQILAPGKSVLLTVRNTNGGVASFQLNAN